MFSRKAIFEFDKPANMDLEELELELIDAGLEEIEEEEGLVIVTADYKDFGNLQTAFENLKIELKKAVLERVANTPIELTDEQMEHINKMIDRLEDDEDVQNIFTNFS